MPRRQTHTFGADSLMPVGRRRCKKRWRLQPVLGAVHAQLDRRRRLHQCGARYLEVIREGTPSPRTTRTSSVRQSVTIPAELAIEVRRVAKQRHLTMSRALVALAERGVEAEAAARDNLNAAYQKFMSEIDIGRKNEAGKELIRSIFGRDAVAEDSVF